MGKTIAVLGGGSAGLTAARTAHRLGARVLLFMGQTPGRASLCVNAGCMPSKAMFQPIDEMHHARRRGWLHVAPRRPADHLAQIVEWKDGEIARFRAYRQATIRSLEAKGLEVVRAPARFRDAHTVEAGGKRWRFDSAIIATGSRSFFPPIAGLKELRDQVLTNEEILANRELPESLVVLGGGAIGLEFSLRYARLGCRVTVLSRSRLLPARDAEAGRRLARIYEKEGVQVLTEHEVVRVARDPDGWFVIQADGPERTVQVAGRQVLVATGRRADVESLDPAAAGVECEEGSIPVAADMRIRGHDHLFAAGDVNGTRMVVHHAHIEAGIAAENAVHDGDRTWSRRANLQVVFSDPEFAAAGMGAEEAARCGREVHVATAESRLVGKFHLIGDEGGMGRLVADARSHAVLGAWLLCDGAGELIHMPAYAIEHEHDVHRLAGAEYYHPTRMEIVARLADQACRKLGGRPYSRADE